MYHLFNHREHSPTQRVRGFTLVELLVVLAILTIIAVFVVTGFAEYAAQKSFEDTSSRVVDAVYTARQQSLSAVGNTTYGIYVGTSTVELFPGTVVVPGATVNEIISLPDGISATSSLSGNSTSTWFSHLQGDASATGTIVLTDVTGRTATITIQESGAVSW